MSFSSVLFVNFGACKEVGTETLLADLADYCHPLLNLGDSALVGKITAP